jgi:hypothetical protein
MPDLQSLYLNVTDHDLLALSGCTAGFVPHVALRELVRGRPNIAVLWRDTLIDAAIFGEWMVNLGQREPPAASHTSCLRCSGGSTLSD